MNLLAPEVVRHLDAIVPPRHPEMVLMEDEAARTGFPIIGPASGHFCYLLARAIGARRIFELGSGFGYSTAWFARALARNGGGEVHHVVWDTELSRRAQGHLAAIGVADLVRFHVDEAVATLRATPGPFDLIFNDIDKHAYPASLDVIAERLRPGGLLIVDNALWQGRIFDERDRSPATEGVRELTRRLTTEPGWVTSLAPIRDGLIVALRT